MSVATQFKVSDVTIEGASQTKITNLSLPNANTEYSLALSLNLKMITIRSRLLATIKFSFTSGESGTKYITLKPGTVFSRDNLTLASSTLYIQSNVDLNVIEILEFF